MTTQEGDSVPSYIDCTARVPWGTREKPADSGLHAHRQVEKPCFWDTGLISPIIWNQGKVEPEAKGSKLSQCPKDQWNRGKWDGFPSRVFKCYKKNGWDYNLFLFFNNILLSFRKKTTNARLKDVRLAPGLVWNAQKHILLLCFLHQYIPLDLKSLRLRLGIFQLPD